MRPKWLVAMPIGVASLYGLPATAQESAPPQALDATPSVQTGAAASEASEPHIAEVVVTAQKRAQNLQDVPLAITAFSADAIEKSRLVGITDIAENTPGLTFDSFPNTQPRPRIRGIGSSDRGAAGDPSVSVFIDGVYYGRPAAVNFDAFDVERIEVLKGPQGTLWGKNVLGGAVSVINKRPDTKGFDSAVELTGGDYGRIEGSGFINTPLGDRAAFRLSGSSRNQDGYTRNDYIGGHADDDHTNSLRAQFLFMPLDEMTVQIGADGTFNRMHATARHVVAIDPDSATGALWTVNKDPDRFSAETNGRNDRDTGGIHAELNWDLGFASLTDIAAYRRLVYHYFEDFDGGNPTFNVLNFAGGNDEHSSFWSNELRLASPATSKLNWTTGLFYYSGIVQRVDSLLANQDPTLTPPATYPMLDEYDQHNSVKSYAAFGDATYPVLDTVDVFAGARFSHDRKDYDISTLNTTVPLRTEYPYAASASHGWSSFTWRLGSNWKPTKRTMLYAVASKGFKSGGFEDTPATPEAAMHPYKPEYATQYEIGAKTLLFGGRLQWNNSVYRTDYRDLQVRKTIDFSTFTTNAGGATVQGYETEAQWLISDDFSLSLTYAWTDSTYKDLEINGVSYSGNRLVQSPRNTVGVSPSFHHQLASGAGIEASLNYQYQSKAYDDANNNPITVRDSRTLLDARLAYEMAGGHWNLSVWGKNLTDEVYRTQQTLFQGADFATYGPPRMIGATLRWSYQ